MITLSQLQAALPEIQLVGGQVLLRHAGKNVKVGLLVNDLVLLTPEGEDLVAAAKKPEPKKKAKPPLDIEELKL